jgi:hypothetical protein
MLAACVYITSYLGRDHLDDFHGTRFRGLGVLSGDKITIHANLGVPVVRLFIRRSELLEPGFRHKGDNRTEAHRVFLRIGKGSHLFAFDQGRAIREFALDQTNGGVTDGSYGLVGRVKTFNGRLEGRAIDIVGTDTVAGSQKNCIHAPKVNRIQLDRMAELAHGGRIQEKLLGRFGQETVLETVLVEGDGSSSRRGNRDFIWSE